MTSKDLHNARIWRKKKIVQVTVQNGRSIQKSDGLVWIGFLNELGFAPLVEQNENPHDYYIPENIFYRLCRTLKTQEVFNEQSVNSGSPLR